jgi:hypothetical protein
MEEFEKEEETLDELESFGDDEVSDLDPLELDDNDDDPDDPDDFDFGDNDED